MTGFLDLVKAISTPGIPIDVTTMEKHQFGALASLSSFAWPVIMLGSDQGHPKNPLWNKDFVSACCDKWLRAQSLNVQPATTIMYHSTCLVLHVDISLLQRFATQSLRAKNGGQALNDLHNALGTWINSDDHQIAVWHARGIHHYGEIIYDRAVSVNVLHRNSREFPGEVATARSLGAKMPSTSQGRLRAVAEPPHLPYAVYFATIVLCTSTVLMKSRNNECITHLNRGKHILSRSQLRVAQLLSRVLDGAQWPSTFSES